MTDADGTPRTQPALRTLQVDQRELLVGGDRVEHGLRSGFPTLRDAIAWYQRASARTFGLLADEFGARDLVRDRTLGAALVTGPDRDDLADEPLSLELARGYRRRLERVILRPACNRAYNRLRLRAGEYLEDDNVSPNKVQPDRQTHVAMRPSLERKDREQAAALAELWGGFPDEDALLDWLHDLDEPSNGALDGRLAARLARDETAREHLLADEQAAADVADAVAARWREHFAALVLLPAFNRGIRRIDSGELVEQESAGLSTPQG